VFSVVDAVVVRALPYPDPEQLTSLSGTTLGEFTRIREINRSWSEIAAYRAASINLSGDGEPERLDGALSSPSLFTVLGLKAAMGRTFLLDQLSGVEQVSVALLSDGLWRRRFGADPAIVGKKIMVEGAPFTVVGVMPADFGFPTRDAKMWIPINMPPARSGALWGNGGWRLIGRLRPNVTAAQAQQELRALFGQLRFENPVWTPGPEYGRDASVRALQQQLVGSARTMLFLLLGVVAVVLLIACANVANLLLVRATARQREVAIRMAVGGGRGRIVRQLLTESVVLAALGGVAGLFVAWIGVRELLAVLPADIPRVIDIGIDMRVLAFTSVLVVAAGVMFGLLPALRASGDVQPTLRDGTQSATGSHRRLAALLVSGEIAAAVLLVIGASLLIRSASALQNVDPGFRVSSIVAARVTPPRGPYSVPGSLARFYRQVVANLGAIPGVQIAAAVDRPSLGRIPVGGLATRIEGQAEDIGQSLPMIAHSQVVTSQYFTAMNIPIIAGRGFTEADRDSVEQVAVVSESVARRFWQTPGAAVGRRVGYPFPSPWMRVVGVAKDVKIDSLTADVDEAIYFPQAQAGALNMTLIVRTTRDIGSIAPDIRRAVAAVDPGTPVSDVESMRSMVDRSAARQRFATLLLALFAGVALALGVVGIYGVMSYAVAQRQREIGIRMALGASPDDARFMVLREGLGMAAIGIAAGLPAAVFAARLLGGLLVGVKPTDPATFVAVPLLLAAVALLASYLPARRATLVDPTVALRER
jgi:putative ABC transport system permease protein